MIEDGMLLYHGSYAPINKIELDVCSTGKDFGKGFYLTENQDQARNFIENSLKKAKNIGKIPSTQNYGYVTVFRYREPKNELPVYEFLSADREWLWFVSMNRRTHFADIIKAELDPKLFSAEIISGKIANDTTNPTITAYLNELYGDIRSEAAVDFAIKQLMVDRLKNQFCFLSERAVSCLELVRIDQYE